MRTTRGGPDGQGDSGPVLVEAPDDVDVRIHARRIAEPETPAAAVTLVPQTARQQARTP